MQGKYIAGGVELLSIAGEFGTPVYVYNASVIKRQYDSIVQAFSGADLRIKYACKANTNISVLKYIRSLGAGIDAVSIEEVTIALQCGFKPAEILFTPNGVAYEEIRDRKSTRLNSSHT